MNLKFAQSGYSLVELVLVAFVAGLIILVLVNIVPAMNFVQGSNNENTARQIVAKRLEDLRAQGYDNLADGTTSFTDPRLVSLPQSAASTNIIDCPSNICTQSENVKQVTIQVTWSENNKNKQFAINTLIAKGGIK